MTLKIPKVKMELMLKASLGVGEFLRRCGAQVCVLLTKYHYTHMPMIYAKVRIPTRVKKVIQRLSDLSSSNSPRETFSVCGNQCDAIDINLGCPQDIAKKRKVTERFFLADDCDFDVQIR
jgi:hypothetical protein